MSAVEVFERARDAGARLLSVERLPGVTADEQLAAGFLLVFDVGRVLVAADARSGQLKQNNVVAHEETRKSDTVSEV